MAKHCRRRIQEFLLDFFSSSQYSESVGPVVVNEQYRAPSRLLQLLPLTLTYVKLLKISVIVLRNLLLRR